MKSYNLNNCLQVYKKLNTIDECLQSKSPSLGATIREKGIDFSEAFLESWLINLNEILNLNKPMSETQITLCTQEVLSTYYNLNISDLTLLFKRIMRGEFGEFYESLSIPKVLTFFRDYYEERMNRAYYINNSHHMEEKAKKEFNTSKNIKRIWRNKS